MIKRFAAFEIKALSNQIRRKMDDTFNCSGLNSQLSGVHGWVMAFLYDNRHRAVYQRDIEEECKLRGSTTTAMLQALEKNKLISRETSEVDARLKCVVLSKKGKELHERVMAEIEMFENQLLKNMAADEMDTFFNTLNKLKINLKNFKPQRKAKSTSEQV